MTSPYDEVEKLLTKRPVGYLHKLQMARTEHPARVSSRQRVRIHLALMTGIEHLLDPPPLSRRTRMTPKQSAKRKDNQARRTRRGANIIRRERELVA